MIGINGIAGRIGKFAAYELVQLGEQVTVVNDLASTDDIVESLSHRDSVHGSLDWVVKKVSDDKIAIDGKEVRVTHVADPAMIEWGETVKAICECTGRAIKKEDSMKHYNNGPNLRTVLISAPGKGDMPTLVMGINHADYNGEKVVSNASCTTKALAMPMKVLLDGGLGIYAVLMDTTHAATNTQKPLDFMSEYGALDTIQSAKTGAAIATGKVIPYLEGKMDGFAMRVPTRDGSFANAYFVAEGPDLSVQGLNHLLAQAESNSAYMQRIVAFNGAEIASPDIIGNTASSVIVLSKTKSILLPFPGNNATNLTALVGIVSGYDNERGPAKDLALLTQYVMRR